VSPFFAAALGRGRRAADYHRKVTIAVVGAGIIGCAVAFELARRGFPVEVFDARHVGAGATHATAGVLAPFIEGPAPTPLQELLIESFRLYDEFVADVEATAGVAVEYRRCGTFELADAQEGRSRLDRVAHLAQTAGFEAVWTNLSQAEGGGVAGFGLLIHAQGYVRVEQLITALKRGAESRGARFHEGEAVQRVEDAGTSVTVHTRQRRLDYGATVVAAGAWSDALSAETVGVRPVRGQIVRLGWQGPTPAHVLWTPDCYVVPWMDGQLLVGATVEEVGFDGRVTVEGIAGLLRAAARLLPGAADATFLEARAGLRPATSDGLPVIRPSRRSERILYATGHFRNGILLTPVTSRRIADLIAAIR
jgi:glycine oxidase